METLVALNAFFSFLSGYSALFESAQLSAKSLHRLRGFLETYRRDVDFIALYDQGHVEFARKQMPHLAVLDDDDVEVALLLAGALFFRYYTTRTFTEIHVAGHTSLLRALPMDQFYTQLSYIPHRDLTRRESLLYREKESSRTKVKRSPRFSTRLSHDYISGNVLAGSDRIIISGNPGVGKSTYARWLCHEWSKQQVSLNGLLIHVNLRDLRFEGSNALVDYVCQTYLAGQSGYRDAVHKLLTVRNKEFIFLLDGFDELSRHQQHRLLADLRVLSDTSRYVLLSRPYGLLYHRFHHDTSFQIDGFNESSIVRYVTHLLDANPTPGKTPDDLLQIIQENRILSDYAHTPLMLSFIVLVYLTSQKPRARLRAVDSVYALQQEVLSWLVAHARAKNPEFSSTQDQLDTGRALAAEMELAQAVAYTSKGAFDPYEAAARMLSAVGVGSQKAYGVGGAWSFTFNTITFQELLAAEHLAPRLNAESFIYLIKDRFFWNFVKFVVGYLSSREEDAVLDKVGAALRAAHVKEGRTFYLYTYVMLISETRSVYLQALVSEQMLEDLVETYRQAYFDEYWPQLLGEAIGRIHSKLSRSQQTYFRRLVCNRIAAVAQMTPATNAEAEELFYLTDIVEAARLHRDPHVVKVLLKTLVALAEGARTHLMTYERHEEAMDDEPSISPDSDDPDVYEQYLWSLNAMLIFYGLLRKADPSLIALHRDLVASLQSKRLQVCLEDEAHLAVCVYPLNGLLDQADRQLEKTQRILGKSEPGTANVPEALEQDRIDAVVELSLLFYAISVAGGRVDGGKQPALDFIGRTRETLFSMQEQVELEGYLAQEAHELVVQALNKIRSPRFFDDMFDAAARHSASLLLKMDDTNAFHTYVDRLITENADGAFDKKRLWRLIACFKHTENGRYAFSSFRDRLFDILHDWLVVHAEALQQRQGVLDEAWPETAESELFTAEAEMADALAATPHFDFDVKYVVDRLLESDIRANAYVRGTLLPRLLSDDAFAFYQENYWDFILDLAQDPARAPEIISILEKSGVYHYGSNLLFVDAALDRLLPHLQRWPEDLRQGETFSLLAIAGQALKTLKRAENDDIVASLTKKTGLLLAFPEVRQLFREGVITETLDPAQALAYVLQYYFTRDETFDLGIDYEAFTESDPALRAGMVQMMVELFSSEDTVHVRELRQREAILGPAFTKRIVAHVEVFSFLHHRYRQETFMKLLGT